MMVGGPWVHNPTRASALSQNLGDHRQYIIILHKLQLLEAISTINAGVGNKCKIVK